MTRIAHFNDVAAFYRALLPSLLGFATEQEVRVGRRTDPHDRVGTDAQDPEPERQKSKAVDAGVAAVATRNDETIEASIEPVAPEPRPRVRPPRLSEP